ncbi:RsfA family transcriptional regulator [Paenibacillus endoradicis]|uniref:RsfA family transcriptional regulator n=1 Tax=Candidatus Pristimantibacillus lignocellulolyticus TaxID=2994561 RepID=A0A9J6ZB45_9BACL|nr:RsfA family transcriptional regulator [Paenibacillus endoradicis]MCR8655988.1 RsfA family transcriptional regulator [Paenibacillus endoradicis]MCR8658314.1 RsfA family transcriptional regulator [Paenibacillus endoradicis]URN93168.1 MAG: RsfA family transcriptional regulator [Candidatus Pristimantibacillus lignocellulolyticus]
MTAIRQDAWSQDDDLMLAEVTLRHIREGSTQLSAFEEVGERIGRTSAACGFRWNSFVRKQYDEAIQIAKQQRHKRNYMKKQVASLPQVSSITMFETDERPIRMEQGSIEESMSIDSVIRFLREWKMTYQDLARQIRSYEKSLKDREDELYRLRQENERLAKEVNIVQTDYHAVNDDYKTLIQIMDRARRLTVLSTEEEKKPRFKMDANGNLERIE